MIVVCEASFRSTDRGMTAFSLWLKIWMPSVMPIGTTLLLPTPKTFEEPIEAYVAGYTVADDLVVCTARTTGQQYGVDQVESLPAIGYRESYLGLEKARQRLMVDEPPDPYATIWVKGPAT